MHSINNKSELFVALAILVSGLVIVPGMSLAFAQQNEIKQVQEGLKQAAVDASTAFTKDVDDSLGNATVGTEESNDTHGPIGNVSEPTNVNNTNQENGTVVVDNSNGTSQGNTTVPVVQNTTKLVVDVKSLKEKVARGKGEASLSVTATDGNSGQAVSNATVSGSLKLAGGTIYTANGKTDEKGTYLFYHQIFSASGKGTATFNASVISGNQTESGHTSFEIVSPKDLK